MEPRLVFGHHQQVVRQDGMSTASGAQPTSAATARRARSSAARALRPAWWIEEGLPVTASAARTASITSGRTGAVAL
jgi:hypothetical protein